MEAQYLCLDWVYGEKLIYSAQKKSISRGGADFFLDYTAYPLLLL